MTSGCQYGSLCSLATCAIWSLIQFGHMCNTAMAGGSQWSEAPPLQSGACVLECPFRPPTHWQPCTSYRCHFSWCGLHFSDYRQYFSRPFASSGSDNHWHRHPSKLASSRKSSAQRLWIAEARASSLYEALHINRSVSTNPASDQRPSILQGRLVGCVLVIISELV